MTPARLILAATPIGNPGDASARLRDALATATVIAAEDTRRLKRLTSDLGVTVRGRVVSYFDHNERDRIPELIERLQSGDDVLVVTDAGMPSVSDPGYRLVAAAASAGIQVTCLPGPSAVLAALAVSGLASDRFCFEGFLPRKSGERERALQMLTDERRTMVFFEAPHRTAQTVAAMAAVFGAERVAALCRELTKTYEEVVRGTLAELSTWAGSREVLGEVVLVVGGASARVTDPAVLVAAVLERVAAGERMKDVVASLAGPHGMGKKELYDIAVSARAVSRGTYGPKL